MQATDFLDALKAQKRKNMLKTQKRWNIHPYHVFVFLHLPNDCKGLLCKNSLLFALIVSFFNCCFVLFFACCSYWDVNIARERMPCLCSAHRVFTGGFRGGLGGARPPPLKFSKIRLLGIYKHVHNEKCAHISVNS